MSGNTTVVAARPAPSSDVPGLVFPSRYLARPGKRALVAADLDDLRGPVGGTIELPIWLFWHPNRTFDLDDPAIRRWVYQIVLREASRPEDLTTHLNGKILAQLWPGLRLPKGVRRAWEEQHPSLALSLAA
jgi:hypothetical protein